MIKQIPCKYCKQPGTVIQNGELFYARCTNCKKWPAFNFLGSTVDNAIRNWNDYNGPQPKPKRKKL